TRERARPPCPAPARSRSPRPLPPSLPPLPPSLPPPLPPPPPPPPRARSPPASSASCSQGDMPRRPALDPAPRKGTCQPDQSSACQQTRHEAAAKPGPWPVRTKDSGQLERIPAVTAEVPGVPHRPAQLLEAHALVQPPRRLHPLQRLEVADRVAEAARVVEQHAEQPLPHAAPARLGEKVHLPELAGALVRAFEWRDAAAPDHARRVGHHPVHAARPV